MFTAAGHGYAANDAVVFRTVTGGAPLVVGTTYYARDITTNTFKVSATPGGTAVDLTADLTAGAVSHPVAETDITIDGYAPLPRTGTVSGSVVAP